MGDRLLRFATAFVLTQLIEIPIYMRGLRVRPLTAFGASALTHPIVWFVIPLLWSSLYSWAVGLDGRLEMGREARFLGYGVLAEGFAVAGEAAYFKALGVEKAFRWSLIANAVSALLGLALSRAVGWP